MHKVLGNAEDTGLHKEVR